MKNSGLIAFVAWLVPGGGYFLIGRKWSGAILLGATILLLLIGVRFGGLYYPGSAADFGIMYYLHQAASAGNAIFVLLNLFAKQSLQSADAQTAFSSAYFEYAGRCLSLAGLINYLAILDALDIWRKRK